jgi:hypothetical protein
MIKVFDVRDERDRHNADQPIPAPKPVKRTCSHCGPCGSAETYEGQATMPIGGRVVCVDWCIHHIVAALNAGGVTTTACCCGHGDQDGRIDLADGRILVIKNDG